MTSPQQASTVPSDRAYFIIFSVFMVGIFLPFFNFFAAFLAAICCSHLAWARPQGGCGIVCILQALSARPLRGNLRFLSSLVFKRAYHCETKNRRSACAAC